MSARDWSHIAPLRESGRARLMLRPLRLGDKIDTVPPTSTRPAVSRLKMPTAHGHAARRFRAGKRWPEMKPQRAGPLARCRQLESGPGSRRRGGGQAAGRWCHCGGDGLRGLGDAGPEAATAVSGMDGVFTRIPDNQEGAPAADEDLAACGGLSGEPRKEVEHSTCRWVIRHFEKHSESWTSENRCSFTAQAATAAGRRSQRCESWALFPFITCTADSCRGSWPDFLSCMSWPPAFVAGLIPPPAEGEP